MQMMQMKHHLLLMLLIDLHFRFKEFVLYESVYGARNLMKTLMKYLNIKRLKKGH